MTSPGRPSARTQVGAITAAAKEDAVRRRRQLITELRQVNALIADLESTQMACGVETEPAASQIGMIVELPPEAKNGL